MPKNQESGAHFTIGPSAWLIKLIAGLHTISLLACWLNALPIVIKLLLSVMAAASWYFQHQSFKDASYCVHYTPTAGWTLSFVENANLTLNIQTGTVSNTLLTVLHYEAQGKCSTLLIFKDAIIENDYRRLIVLLKTSGLKPPT